MFSTVWSKYNKTNEVEDSTNAWPIVSVRCSSWRRDWATSVIEPKELLLTSDSVELERISPYKAVFRPPLFIEDFYPGRIRRPSWVKRCIKFFRKARFFFPTHPHPRGGVRENRNWFSQARDLVFMQLTRVSNDDSILPWESKLACSKGELWRYLDRPFWWSTESP
jgi:hypothetical protein